MEEKKRLPDGELCVMQAVWAHGGEVSRADIESALGERAWSANTVNTYLARLCEKGFLTSRREGHGNLYAPRVDRESYLHFDSRATLGRLYGGSIRNFVAALCAEKPLEQSEIDALRRCLDDMTKEAR